MLRAFAQIIAVLFLAIASGALAQTARAPLVTGYVPSLPGLAAHSDTGSPNFSVAVSRDIAEALGLALEIREYPTLAALFDAHAAGEVTLLSGIAPLPQFAGTSVFSEPVGQARVRLAVTAERSGEFPDADVRGLRIAVLQGLPAPAEQALLAVNTAVRFETPERAIVQLLSGNVDALLLPDHMTYRSMLAARIDHRIVFVNDPVRVSDRIVSLHESRASLLPEVNEAIATLQSDGQFASLRARYLIDVPPPPDVLSVGITHFPSYNIVGEDGSLTGFDVETLHDVLERAGIAAKIREISLEEWARGPGPDTYDMLPSQSINEARAGRMDFTLPLEERRTFAFYRADSAVRPSDIEDFGDLVVGVPEGTQAASIAEKAGIGNPTVVPEVTDLLNALVAGEVDVALHTGRRFEDLIGARDLEDEIVAAPTAAFVAPRTPALRFGLGEIRERMNAVIPAYTTSDDQVESRAAFFEDTNYWTSTRLLLWGDIVLAFVLISIGALAWSRFRADRAARLDRARQAAETAAIRDELETVLNAATSGIVALDTDGSIVRINPRARHMLGGISDPTPFAWPPNVGFLDAETMTSLEASADPIRRALSGHDLRGETHLLRRLKASEDHRYVRVDSARFENPQSGISVVFVIDDVSEQERNRQVVERRSRLDALGQLTGGIAHDFNNLLAAMLYAVDLAGKSEDPARRREYLHIATTSIQRGRDLTSRLLAFAKRQPGLSTSRDVNDVFKDFNALISPMIEAQIEVTFEASSDDLQVFCDHAQLETALMNLVLNSRDALLRSGKGNRIEIRARPVRAHEKDLEERQGKDDQIGPPDERSSYRYVEISVADNGPGMDNETLSRSTDPFFTTKKSNSGTGLGLSMVYGFIRQADGDLRIYSEENVGTTVQLTLPRGTVTGTREERVPVEVPILGHGENILVVEDEPQLLQMMTSLLEDLGYSVVSAASGDDALRLIENGTPFDLLLTDVVMPGKIGGFELARRVRKTHPSVPVVYTSGYTGFTASEMGEVTGPLLQKPTPPAELARTLHAAIDPAQPAMH